MQLAWLLSLWLIDAQLCSVACRLCLSFQRLYCLSAVKEIGMGELVLMPISPGTLGASLTPSIECPFFLSLPSTCPQT